MQRCVENLAGRRCGVDGKSDGRSGRPGANCCECDADDSQDFREFHFSRGSRYLVVRHNPTVFCGS
jgi:hypothetical protein